MPRPMPTSIAELNLPNLAWDYLGEAERYPFEEGKDALSLVNAWWLMELSFLVYASDTEFVNEKLARAGFSGAKTVNRASNRVMIVRDANKLVVCFRGTLLTNVDNLITDAKFAHKSFEDMGKVHRGFLHALDSLWEDIEQELAERGSGRDIWFTGHSLGGALAVLAAARWKKPCRLYTFGCPRVGDRSFRDSFPPLPHYRFVHDHDVVTQLPPPVGYRHVGELCHLRRDGSLGSGAHPWAGLVDNVTDRLPGLIRKIRDNEGVWQSLVGDNAFADHCPISYAIRLGNLIER